MRLAGEDSRRGTFTQRHAVLINPSNAEEYNPLDALARSQGPGKFLVYNSALTEYAGMGFEYGYSVGNPGCRGGLGGTVWRLCQWCPNHH